MFDLKKLRYFLQIAETGSFSLAARRLSLAQPALSRHIRELENDFGPLFRRNGRGAELTEMGSLLLPRAEALVREADKAFTELQSTKGAPMGAVMLGMPPSVTTTLVPPLVKRIKREFPGIRLRVSEGLSGDLNVWLNEGRLDLAVLYKTGRSARAIGHLLLTEDLYLVGSPDAQELPRTSIRLSEAVRLPLILPGKPHGLRLLIEAAAAQQELELNVEFELDATHLIKELIVDAGSFTILPFGAVHQQVEQGTLRAARICESAITRELILAESPHRVLTPAMREVLKAIHSEVETLVARGVWIRSTEL